MSAVYHEVPDGAWLSRIPGVRGVHRHIGELLGLSVLHSMHFLTSHGDPVHVFPFFQGLGDLYTRPLPNRRLLRLLAIVVFSIDSRGNFEVILINSGRPYGRSPVPIFSMVSTNGQVEAVPPIIHILSGSELMADIPLLP